MDVINASAGQAPQVSLPEVPENHGLTKIVASALFAILVLSYITSATKAVRSSLGKIPGPWYAPLTSLHLRWLFADGQIWKFAQYCHGKYGDIVRLGPRQIWVADKQALKEILVTTDLPKVTMYAEISRDRNSPGLFGEM